MDQILAKQYKKTCTLALVLILVSLFFNILALTTPFLTIHHLLPPDEVYSLIGAVKLMWKLKLYIIAVLIVGFSIIFPFVKLFYLFFICFILKGARKRFRTISVIEALGKWSMLDIFIVCLILILTNNQYFVSSTPQMGVYFFLLAILISIICSLFVDALCEKTYLAEGEEIDNILHFVAKNFTIIEKRAVLCLAVTAVTFFVFAIFDNYIQVSDFFLVGNAYSIVKTCIALQHISFTLSAFTFFVLIIFPFIMFVGMFIFWLRPYQQTFHAKIIRLIQKLSKFMMLDVFCLSLFLFLWEGDIIIKTKSRHGVGMLVIFVLISLALPFLIKWYAIVRYKISLGKNRKE